jgi:hypothetical protein
MATNKILAMLMFEDFMDSDDSCESDEQDSFKDVVLYSTVALM